MNESLPVAPTVTTRVVIDYHDDLVDMHVQLPSYTGAETMIEIRKHLHEVTKLARWSPPLVG